MSHVNPSRDLAVVVERAVDLLLTKLERDRLGRTGRRRTSNVDDRAEEKTCPENEASARKPSRVPNAVRRAVFEREGFDARTLRKTAAAAVREHSSSSITFIPRALEEPTKRAIFACVAELTINFGPSRRSGASTSNGDGLAGKGRRGGPTSRRHALRCLANLENVPWRRRSSTRYVLPFGAWGFATTRRAEPLPRWFRCTAPTSGSISSKRSARQCSSRQPRDVERRVTNGRPKQFQNRSFGLRRSRTFSVATARSLSLLDVGPPVASCRSVSAHARPLGADSPPVRRSWGICLSLSSRRVLSGTGSSMLHCSSCT